jgi:hypothetical protein
MTQGMYEGMGIGNWNVKNLNILLTWRSPVRKVMDKNCLCKVKCKNGELTTLLYKGNNNNTFRAYILVERKLSTAVKCGLLITCYS